MIPGCYDNEKIDPALSAAFEHAKSTLESWHWKRLCQQESSVIEFDEALLAPNSDRILSARQRLPFIPGIAKLEIEAEKDSLENIEIGFFGGPPSVQALHECVRFRNLRPGDLDTDDTSLLGRVYRASDFERFGDHPLPLPPGIAVRLGVSDVPRHRLFQSFKRIVRPDNTEIGPVPFGRSLHALVKARHFGQSTSARLKLTIVKAGTRTCDNLRLELGL